MMNSIRVRNFLIALFAVIISGIAWYFGKGLSGDYGWLMWVAPLPVLVVSFKASSRQAFFIGFLAYLIGQLSWLSYLLRVLPPGLAIGFTILLPVLFGFLVVASRKRVLAKQSVLSALAFPVFWTAFEFAISITTSDGTAGSIAYSQMNYLSIIQVASITGMWGITFLLTLVPSAMAMSWHYRQNRRLVLRLVTLSMGFCLLAMLYGWIRLMSTPSDLKLKVGLAVLAEDKHHYDDSDSFEKERETTSLYLQKIQELAQQDVRWIIIPEKVINITPETRDSIMSMFIRAARVNKVGIIAGLTLIERDFKENLSIVISPDGRVLNEYKKVHMVQGFEGSFRVGHEVGGFSADKLSLGTAICKDLDFQGWMRQYKDPAILFVPAWDFVADGWLHARMAFLRCVENGYGMVRAARQGRLSIIDYHGRVLAEASCENNQEATLQGSLPQERIKTFYSSSGDWFGWLALGGTITFILAAYRKREDAKPG